MPRDLLEDLSPTRKPIDLLADITKPKKAKKTGYGAIGGDIVSGVTKVPGALAGMVGALPEQLADLAGISETGDYSTERLKKVAAAGLAKGGRGILNIPANAVDYLREKEVIPDWVRAARPESLNKRNYLEDVGITDQRPGDVLIEGTTAFAPNLAFGGPVAGGFAYGVGQNENPVTSALLAPAAKGVAKTAKVALSPIKSTKSALGFKEAEIIRANAAKASKTIADKVALEDLNTYKKTGSDMYNSLIEDTKSKGISKAKINRALAPDFFKETTRKERSAVRKAFETQELKDIHNAYIDLGSYISKQSKKQLLTPERKALEQARAIRKNMKSALEDAFTKAGGAEFAQRFSGANDYWRENVITNEGNALLNNYRAGKLTAEDLIKKAAKNETFRAQLAKKYPELIEYAQVLAEAEKLAKPKPTTAAAKELQKDIKRNELLTQTPKKIGNVVTKTTGLGGLLNWLIH